MLNYKTLSQKLLVRSVIILLIGLYTTAVLFSQEKNEELNEHKLLQSLVVAKDDSIKVDNLRELAEYYLGPKTDTALLLARKAADLSEKIKDEKRKARALFTMGKVFVYMGSYTRGLQLYLQSLEINERIKEFDFVVINLSYIGEVYSYQGDYQQSLSYFFKGKSIAEKNHLDRLPLLLLNIGKTYENMGQLDSARLYILKSYEFSKNFKDDYFPSKILYSLGEIYFRTGETSKALQFYRLSILKSEAIEDYMISCNASLAIAKLLNNAGNKDSAFYYARKSLIMANQAGFLLQKLNATNFLAGYFKEKKKLDSALAYLEISSVLKDSLVSKEKITEFENISFSEQLRQQEMRQAEVQYRNKVKMFFLLGGLSALLIVAIFLWRIIWLKQKANTQLTAQKLEIDKQKDKIETSYLELKSTQAQLIQSEKMASLVALTSGIAHEIQNPLNFVNNFSDVNAELIDELLQQLEARNADEAISIANDIKNNEHKINDHGKRADAIVKGMLQHSRNSTGTEKEPTDINALASEYVRLCFHGQRTKDKLFNATIKTDFDQALEKINIIPQDIGRVILNLLTNAFYAVNEKKKDLQLSNGDYEPTVWVTTKKIGDKVEIRVSDNGNGIPHKVLDKIFQPFFTTKPTGQGTGLGLSISYDIITKGHGGNLKVETIEGEGTAFIIHLSI